MFRKAIKLSLISIVVVLFIGGGWLFFYSTTFEKVVVVENGRNDSYAVSERNESNVAEPIIVQEGSNDKAESVPVVAGQPKKDIEVQAETKTPTEASENEPKTSEPVKSSGDIVLRLLPAGFQKAEAKRAVDTLVLHSSYDALGKDPYSLEGVIKEYEMYGVSAHYLIDRKGTVYQLVKDNDIAYHAGVSQMPDGRKDVNKFSIGIELINTKESKYTDEQYEALRKLIASLKSKYPIKNVVLHSEIAPGRKTDPWGFDKSRLK